MSCISNLVLPDVQRRLPEKPAHEGQNTITCVHLLQPSQHCVPRDQIERTNAINRNDGGIGIRFNKGLENVRHTLCACWFSTHIGMGLWHFALSHQFPVHGPRDEPLKTSPTTMPRTPPSGFVSAVTRPILNASQKTSGALPPQNTTLSQPGNERVSGNVQRKRRGRRGENSTPGWAHGNRLFRDRGRRRCRRRFKNDFLEALTAKRVEIYTVFMQNNASCPSDCSVTEMLQTLPMDFVCESKMWDSEQKVGPQWRGKSTFGFLQEA